MAGPAMQQWQPGDRRPAIPSRDKRYPRNSRVEIPVQATIRGQDPDPPTVPVQQVAANTTISLPPPEELGVLPANPVAAKTTPADTVDWNTIHARLRQLGAVGFHLRKLADDSYRVTFTLPTSQTQRTHLVEVDAQSEAAAVTLALQRAEQWATGGAH